MKKVNSFDLIIFIDDLIFNDLENWWELIVSFGNILFCSLTFYDFSKRNYFD
jgi:hypothetical protein